LNNAGIRSDGRLRKVEEKERAKDEQRTIKQLSLLHLTHLHGIMVSYFLPSALWQTRVETLHPVQLLGYKMDNRRIALRFPPGKLDFFLRGGVQTGSGTTPASDPICMGRIFTYVKRMGDEFDLSPPALRKL
jgi:hypothetical protein